KRSVLFDPSYKEHPELRDLFRQLSVLARWLKVAYDVLSNSVSRTSYDKKIAESPSLPEGPPPKEGAFAERRRRAAEQIEHSPIWRAFGVLEFSHSIDHLFEVRETVGEPVAPGFMSKK